MGSTFADWYAQQAAIRNQELANAGYGGGADPTMLALGNAIANGHPTPYTNSTPPGYGTGPNSGQPAGGLTGGGLSGAAGHAVANQITGSSSGMVPPGTVSSPVGGGGLVPGASVSSPVPSGMVSPMSGAAPVPGYEATSAQLGMNDAPGPAAASTPGIIGSLSAGPYGAAGGAGALAAGAATGYAQGSGILHGIKNQPLSPLEQGALALPTFGASLLVNPLQRFFGSSKGPEQRAREGVVGEMKDKNFLDSSNNYTLADGSKFDFGVDGGAMLQNEGTNIDGGTVRHRYDVDFSDPRVGPLLPVVQGLGAIFSQSSGKPMRDVTGKLLNAALSSGDPQANVKKMIADAGFQGHDQVYGAIHLLQQSGKISQSFGDAIKNALDESYGVGAYANGAAPSQTQDPYKGPATEPTPMQPMSTPQPAPKPKDPGNGTGNPQPQPMVNKSNIPTMQTAQKPTGGPWVASMRSGTVASNPKTARGPWLA